MNSVDCFYYGVQREMGHYLYAGNRRFNERYLPDDFPVQPYILDGRILPPMLPQEEGRAELIHTRDWTLLSFWDRSFDHRHNSSSTFVIRGALTFEKAIEVAREAYPQVWSRFNFEVKQR